MAEIRPDQYQNGDKQKDVEIKRDVKPYITKSYMIGMFIRKRMFNTLPPYYFYLKQLLINTLYESHRGKHNSFLMNPL